MASLLDILILAAGIAVAAFSLVWLVSVAVRDASVVDLIWGPAFVMLAWFYWWVTGGGGPRGTLGLLLVTVWGLRLGAHLARRNIGKPEDYRYQAMRRGWGPRFWWVSLFTVYWLQAVLLWIVSFPLLQIQAAPVPLGVVGWAGAVVAVVGFLFEAIGDHQLTRFRSDPSNEGKVLSEGLWRYTRHPNYFGDAVFWWGITALASEVPGWWWILPGPVLMTVLLMNVSGVPLLEARLAETRPRYADYVRRTNAFVPWFPKAGR